MGSQRPATSPGPEASTSAVSGAVRDDGGATPTPTLQKRHSTDTFTTATIHEPAPTAPPRPPRNPARPSTAERKPKKPKRPSTATGTREEVTPWEFFPVNAPTEKLPILTLEESAKHSSSTPTGKREDVLPWELFPAPDYDAETPKPAISGSQPQPNHTRQPRQSISSSSILSDMALLRRRKSTGAKTPHPPNTPPVAYANGSPRPSTSTNNPSKSPSSSPRLLYKSPSASTVRPPLPKTSSGPVPTISSSETVSPPTPTPQSQTPQPQTPQPQFLAVQAQDPKFSTADRTILQELKRNISARAAQFVIKGGPAESGRLSSSPSSLRLGAKHHAYSREEVPYPRSYAREVLDLDVWETMVCQKICDSLTWHVFQTPPTKVLDIGCGTGTWVLNCGMAWRKCHFVGMDVVPLHPDLGTSELSTRITWVQANFLEGLPFPNDEFDFVHIKRIGLGVPEDKWDYLFEEIARVLKSGGAFELIEEDLFFPGKTSTDDDESDSDVVSELRYAPNDSASDVNEDDESVITGSGGSRISYDGSAPTPNTSLGAPGTPPRTASPLPMVSALIREKVIEEAAEEPTQPTPVRKKSLPTSHPPHRHSYQQRVPSASPSYHRGPSTGSTTSLLGLGPAVAPPMVDRDRKPKPRGYSTSTLVSPPNHHPSVLSLTSTNPSPISATGTAQKPFLLRTLPKAPPNPRDHSLLEGIYIEMNATRFINLSPLSLLANLVGLHFKDVRTHPPLQLTFPPPASQPPPVEDTSSSDESDSDDARNAIVPSPRRRLSLRSSIPSSILGSTPSSPRSNTFSDLDEHRFVNTRDLIKRESRYISLDDARMSAYSPSTRSSFPAMSPLKAPSGLPAIDAPVAPGSEANARGGNMHPNPSAKVGLNRLPNSTFNIDVRSLNMHLALRTAEIIACAESMWEWVVSYQTSSRVAAGRLRAGSLASEVPPRASRILPSRPDPETDAFKSAVIDLTREDFDSLLVRFELDMRDHMAVGSTLRDQFSWPCTPMAPSQDRKAFLAACERWEQWQDQQKRKRMSPYGRHQARNSVDSPYVHGHEGNGFVDRHKPDVLRGRSSLPETASGKRPSPSNAPPDRRLSRSMRVFVAWKP
ncbi:hypothetical protein B0H19DRAFT_1108040 [Mycena capillaripes]|nr:hypothetical protein B0H19DRAFT_1108040 [Mycena capillaripes]